MTAIAAGLHHSLALKQDGGVIAWGCVIDYGQCDVPPAAASGVTAIAAGLGFSLALKQDGSVVAWGCADGLDYGQCTVPAAAGSGVTAIAAGSTHSLALKGDGSVIAWGCRGGDYGQCAVPGTAAGGVTAIAVGYSHSLALKQDGSVVAWGCRIGLDVGNCAVPAAAASGVSAIAAGDRQSLALFPLLAQTITVTVHAPAAATYRTTFAVAASSSGGLPVAVSSGGACSNAGPAFTMTSGTGTCLVTYDQPGEGAFNAAPQVVESVAAQKAAQTIAFGALSARTYGDPRFAVGATASSGLAVSFTSRGACTVSGATVRLTRPGTCTVIASQPGDANYAAAPDVGHTFAVKRRPCTVPNVVGARLARARLALGRNHCRTGIVRYASSSTSAKGVVIAQSRRRGRVLPPGARIDLVVSRGPKG